MLGVERVGLEAENLGGVPELADGEIDVQVPVLAHDVEEFGAVVVAELLVLAAGGFAARFGVDESPLLPPIV
jgi:hypothetical protein